jgi:DNA topoisomerase-3
MQKLLNDGKTDLLPGFVSQRTRRPFKAFLVKGKDGKVSFEFEERKPKAPAKAGKAAGKTAKADKAADAAAAETATSKIAAVPARKAAAKKPARPKATAKKAVA